MKVLVMNAGHSGSERGAIAKNGEFEKDINLDVVKAFKKLAKPYEDQIKILYTRLDDTAMSLAQRVGFANNAKADLYVSVHHNAYNGVADGGEVIHSIGGGEGKRLADIVAKEFQKLGQNIRRVFAKRSNVYKNKDYYYEIRYTHMPAIITEFAFLDSKDFSIIDSQEERVAEAEAILNAILEFYNIEKKDETNELVESLKKEIKDKDAEISKLQRTIDRMKSYINRMRGRSSRGSSSRIRGSRRSRRR